MEKKISFVVVMILSLILGGYGYSETKGGLTITQLSDVEMASLMGGVSCKACVTAPQCYGTSIDCGGGLCLLSSQCGLGGTEYLYYWYPTCLGSSPNDCYYYDFNVDCGFSRYCWCLADEKPPFIFHCISLGSWAVINGANVIPCHE